MQYTPEQEKIIHSWGQGMVIIAGAGCGKTTTLVHKCRALLEKNSQARFAAVSFTERSASDLKEKLSQSIDLYSAGKSNWIMTIHGLCAAIIRDFALEAGLEGGETIIAQQDAASYWRTALESLWFLQLNQEQENALSLLLQSETPDSLSALISRLKSLRSFGIIERLKKSPLQHVQALSVVTEFVLNEYDLKKRKSATLDFDDLEYFANQALKNQDVRRYYQNRFDLVLVDEFQDTNPIQAEIISQFTKPGQTNLCVVGDPKQSIYRFRDADLSVFLETVEKLPLQFSLTWNFRSHPEIIQYVNRTCENLFEGSDIEYETLISKKEQKKEIKHPVIHISVNTPEALGSWIQEQVKEGVNLNEMTLLLRKIKGNEKWIKALKKMGIPLSLESGGLFWENPRVRECVSFLKWWIDPAHQLSAVTFLRAPWVGVSDLKIDEWIRDKKSLKEEFLKEDHPIANQLREIKNTVCRPSQALLQLLATEEIENEIGSALLSLWHLCEDLSLSGKTSYEISLHLSEMLENTPRAKEIPPPPNLGSLSVLTLHSSKGLEFDRVILVDFDGQKRASPSPSFYWDRKEGFYLAQRDEHAQKNARDQSEKKWKDLEKWKDLNESKRLYYVALTRAKEQLVLVSLPEKKPSKEKNIYQVDDWRAWTFLSKASVHQELIEADPNQTFQATELKRNHEKTHFKETVKYKRARHSVTEWVTLEKCQRAYEWRYIRPRPVTEVKEDAFQKAVQELGTQVHAVLESPSIEKIQELEQSKGITQFQSAPLLEWMESSELMQMKADQKVWTELSFEVPVRPEVVLVGSLDRLIQGPLGYTIVDFKVTQNQTEPEVLKERYMTQMLLYQKALVALQGCEFNAVRCCLVNIHPQGVQEIWVQTEDKAWETWIDPSSHILSTPQASVSLGKQCHYCEFRFDCPEASKSFGFSRSDQ